MEGESAVRICPKADAEDRGFCMSVLCGKGENLKIIFATSNEHKMEEIRMILGDLGAEILSMREAGIAVEIEENGATFAENAAIKVRAIRPFTDAIVMADDSGLVIDALNGGPGVYSARYMEGSPYSERNRNLIQRLEGKRGTERSARFVCAIAASLPDGRLLTTQGTMEGVIAQEPAGENGFGYDPILYLPEYGMTAAELSPEEKNAISHRGKALRAMREELGKL